MRRAAETEETQTVQQGQTYTATPDREYAFIGWYDGETKVADSANDTFTATKGVTL